MAETYEDERIRKGAFVRINQKGIEVASYLEMDDDIHTIRATMYVAVEDSVSGSGHRCVILAKQSGEPIDSQIRNQEWYVGFLNFVYAPEMQEITIDLDI